MEEPNRYYQSVMPGLAAFNPTYPGLLNIPCPLILY